MVKQLEHLGLDPFRLSNLDRTSSGTNLADPSPARSTNPTSRSSSWSSGSSCFISDSREPVQGPRGARLALQVQSRPGAVISCHNRIIQPKKGSKSTQKTHRCHQIDASSQVSCSSHSLWFCFTSFCKKVVFCWKTGENQPQVAIQGTAALVARVKTLIPNQSTDLIQLNLGR